MLTGSFYSGGTSADLGELTSHFVISRDTFPHEALVGRQDDGTYIVGTSQIIDPAGVTRSFPGRPVDLVLNRYETILAVKNMSSIVFFDVKKRSIIQTLELPKNIGHTYNGIAWGPGDKNIWTSDSRGFLRSASIGNGGLFAWDDSIELPGLTFNDKEVFFDRISQGSYPGGFAIDSGRNIIYVALNRNNELGVVNLKSRKLEKKIPVGIAPYAVKLKGNKAYVTNWGGRRPNSKDMTSLSSGSPVVVDKTTGIASSGTVSVIDLTTEKLIAEIRVQLHPSGMALGKDGSQLFVANANSDVVSVIDTRSDKVVKTISTKPMKELPFGSAPNALALSADSKTLYAANAGNNVLAVIDVTSGRLKGLIPTGWYPSAVALSQDGSELYVANTKGLGSVQEGLRTNGHSVMDQLGSVSFIPVPDRDSLEEYTIKAATNMRLPKITQSIPLQQVSEKLVPVPTKPGEKSVFKHVIYIVKENRTYDQVLGDMPQGNGDSSLCQFGRMTTPNHHSLSEEFVLLDNMYCNGVKSAEGHQWTSQGYVTDYLEKAFPDFARSYPWSGDDPLVFASSGFIWDNVLKAGLRFRTYGEFVQDKVTPPNASWTDHYIDYINGTGRIKIRASARLHTIRPYVCSTYTGSPRTISDQYKATEFIKELHAFEKTGSFPNFMILSLPNDHTSATQEGFPTPRAMVADNDLALGRIVEAVSRSKFWKETAIFVIEDDPQNGLDHVEGRRTISFCISPYTKRKTVVSTHYNQNSILRTMELILGLAPLSQFDLIATPMVDCFTNEPDFAPYTVLPNLIPLNEMNPKITSLSGKQKFWARKSMEMSLAIDEADEGTLNQILWHSVKGYDTPYPVLPKH